MKRILRIGLNDTFLKARNHTADLQINNKYYGLSILTNTGSNEDLAILGGGHIREYTDMGEPVVCPQQVPASD